MTASLRPYGVTRTPARPRALATVLAVLTAAAGCGGAAAPGGPGPGVSHDLLGKEYVSTSVTGHELVAGTTVRLDFLADGTLLAHAGCNSMSGQARLDGGVLTVSGDGLATTEMGCEQRLHAQDEWLAAFLGGRPTASRDGDELVLASGDTEIVLLDREVAQPDVALEGTPWTIDTLVTGGGQDGTASSMPAGVTATLTFAGGTVEIDTGCNTGTAPYEVAGSTITFGPAVLTRRGCAPDQQAVEQAITAVLDGPVRFTIDAGRLALDHASGHGVAAAAG